MSSPRYDIFISYRKDSGRQYARALQLALETRKYGYRVFLDYDELTDGQFPEELEKAIVNSTIFVIVLSKDALVRCQNEADWVRRELEIAVREGKHIVPVNPDGTFNGIPKRTPEHIKKIISETQHSEIFFGSTLRATVDLMVNKRIKPNLPNPIPRPIRRMMLIALLTLAAALVASYFLFVRPSLKLAALKESVTLHGEPIKWSESANEAQVLAARDIFNSLRLVEGGTFRQGVEPNAAEVYSENVQPQFEVPAFDTCVADFEMGQFEVTLGQWNAVMGDCREGEADCPVTAVSLLDAKRFAETLSNLTMRPFRLPSETEWEYAARGGKRRDPYEFAGSNRPKEVAWYAANSVGRAHACRQGFLPAACTSDDLFNMSGNVSEWCDTPFRRYDGKPINNERSVVVRGGNYHSEPYEITVTHRVPALPEDTMATVGFRIVLEK